MHAKNLKLLCIALIVTSMLVIAPGCGFIKSLGGGKSEPAPPKTEQPKTEDVEQPKPEPPNADNVVQEGVTQLDNGQLNKAIASFEEALNIDPDNAKAAQYLKDAKNQRQELITKHLRRGIELFTNEDLEQAMKEWDAVLALDPNHAEALDYKKQTQARLDALGE